MILLEQPPSLDAQELTDKGSVNQKQVLANRADLVEQLYGAEGSGILISAADGPDAGRSSPRRIELVAADVEQPVQARGGPCSVPGRVLTFDGCESSHGIQGASDFASLAPRLQSRVPFAQRRPQAPVRWATSEMEGPLTWLMSSSPTTISASPAWRSAPSRSARLSQ